MMDFSHWHPLLRRQLKRAGVDAAAESVPAPALRTLCDRISRAYGEHDQERVLLEHSQELAIEEMNALNAQLKQERDRLNQHVRERTTELGVSESRLRRLVSRSADWIWEMDAEGRFTYLSDGITALFGLPPEELIGELHTEALAAAVEPVQLRLFTATVRRRQALPETTLSLTCTDEKQRWVRISGEPAYDPQGRYCGYRGVGRDVTETVQAQHSMEQMARCDSLTGLPNRSAFLAELDRALGRARRTGEDLAVCFIDLDRFKAINDTLGHSAGDELLMEMAARLRSRLRSIDMVARQGGDEFVALLERCGDASDLAFVGQKLLGALSEPVVLAGSQCEISGSIGIARFPADGDDADSLLKHADAAMYLAKERGKNNVQFYTAELANEAARLFSLEAELRQALVRRELLLHYQPKVDIASGRLSGMEALVRWAHPTRGLVPPNDFIPLAEDRGLIVPIGRWVIQEACRQIRAWRDEGLQTVPIAVNLSPRQLVSDTLIDDFADALAHFGLEASDLGVELTESTLMADPQRSQRLLQRLDDMGLCISIDDFGTGYSALAHLKRFPSRTLKVDRSFIRGLPDAHDDMAIVQAIVAMAHALGLEVVAEGVETLDQLAVLCQLGCEQAQGYLLGRPVPADQLEQRLRDEARAPIARAA